MALAGASMADKLAKLGGKLENIGMKEGAIIGAGIGLGLSALKNPGFNKDKMFYLMSRGISKIDATKLMMEALLIGNGNKEEMIVKEFMNKIMEVSNG